MTELEYMIQKNVILFKYTGKILVTVINMPFHYKQLVYNSYGKSYVSPILRGYKTFQYFVIDDDNYGCDTCSDHISYEDITDINICLDELNKIEDLVVDFYADEQIRYEMRFADLDSLDELLIEYKASLIKG